MAGLLGVRTADERFPRFRHCAYPADALTLIKPHGTIEEPDSLVFTLDKLARGMVDADYFAPLRADLESADLFVFAGYGFRDPDLRVPLRALLRKERPNPVRAIYLTNGEAAEPDARSGLEVLRREFLADTTCEPYVCDLTGEDRKHEHFFVGLALRLGSAGPTEAWLPEPWDENRSAAKTDSVLAGFPDEAAMEFVGRLCEAATSGEAYEVVRLLTLASSDDVRRLERSILLCRSLSHQTDYKRYVDTCRELRAKWDNPNVELVTWGFESFAHTVRSHSLWSALRCIRQGRRTAPRCSDPLARATFAHYEGHFWAKLMQYVDVRFCAGLSTPLVLLWRVLARPFARRLALHLRGVAVAAGDSPEPRAQLMSDVRDIETQVWIYAGDLEQARKGAEQCERDIAAVGVPNNLALVDRTRGWVYLAQGEVMRAQSAFARGTYRSLRSEDRSVWPKLAANLVRVLATTPVRLKLTALRGDKKDERDLEACLTRLRCEENREQWGEDGRTVAEHLLHRYGDKAAELMRHLRARLHLKRCPVYHPLQPPDPTDSAERANGQADLRRC